MIRGLLIAILIGIGCAASAQPLQILFLGNSLTGVNDLPAQLKMMAEANGHHPYIEAHLRFGQPLNVHLADPVVVAALHSRAWDEIVLQDYSNLILTDAAAVKAHIQSVHALVPHAHVVIAENWAYAGAPVGTQDEINQRYREVAKETSSELMPLGAAFEDLKKIAPTHVYLPGDDRHPTPLVTSMLARIYLDHFYGDTYQGTMGSSETTPSIFDGEARPFHGFDLRTQYSGSELRGAREFPRRCLNLFN